MTDRSSAEIKADRALERNFEKIATNIGTTTVLAGRTLVPWGYPGDLAVTADVQAPLGLTPWDRIDHRRAGLRIAGPFPQTLASDKASEDDRRGHFSKQIHAAIRGASVFFLWLGDEPTAAEAVQLVTASMTKQLTESGTRAETIVVIGLPHEATLTPAIPGVNPVDADGVLHGRWDRPNSETVTRCGVCLSNPELCSIGRRLSASRAARRFVRDTGVAERYRYVWDFLPFADLVVYGDDATDAIERWAKFAVAMGKCASSPAEKTFLTTALHLGLPELEDIQAQYEVSAWGRSYRLDFALPDARIYIEIDGNHHFEHAQVAKDYHRQNALLSLGWVPVRLRAAEVRGNPRWAVGAAARIVEALVSRRGALEEFRYPGEIGYRENPDPEDEQDLESAREALVDELAEDQPQDDVPSDRPTVLAERFVPTVAPDVPFAPIQTQPEPVAGGLEPSLQDFTDDLVMIDPIPGTHRVRVAARAEADEVLVSEVDIPDPSLRSEIMAKPWYPFACWVRPGSGSDEPTLTLQLAVPEDRLVTDRLLWLGLASRHLIALRDAPPAARAS